jgi:hypothetical protein
VSVPSSISSLSRKAADGSGSRTAAGAPFTSPRL